MNEAWHICMGHYTHMYGSCHIREASHTCEWGITHVNEALHTSERGMSHIWMRCLACEWGMTHMYEALHTYVWVMSHRSYVTHMNEVSDVWTRPYTHLYEALHTHVGNNSPCSDDVSHEHLPALNRAYHAYEYVVSHIGMGHTTHMNTLFHTYAMQCVAVSLLQCVAVCGLHTATHCSPLTHRNGAYYTYEYVISRLWRLLLQNIVSFIGLFCKRDLHF